MCYYHERIGITAHQGISNALGIHGHGKIPQLKVWMSVEWFYSVQGTHPLSAPFLQLQNKILILIICAAGIGGTFQYGYNISIINAPASVSAAGSSASPCRAPPLALLGCEQCSATGNLQAAAAAQGHRARMGCSLCKITSGVRALLSKATLEQDLLSQEFIQKLCFSKI